MIMGMQMNYINFKMTALGGQHSPCSSMVEQRPPKPKVVGSIPITDAFLN